MCSVAIDRLLWTPHFLQSKTSELQSSSQLRRTSYFENILEETTLVSETYYIPDLKNISSFKEILTFKKRPWEYSINKIFFLQKIRLFQLTPKLFNLFTWAFLYCSLPNPTTSFLTAAILVYTIRAGITAAAGTRLAL